MYDADCAALGLIVWDYLQNEENAEDLALVAGHPDVPVHVTTFLMTLVDWPRSRQEASPAQRA